MQRVVLCLTVSLALVFSASLGPAAASAQSGGGNKCWRTIVSKCATKKVETFLKAKARILAEAQPVVFPSARISARKVYNGCVPHKRGRNFVVRVWGCSGFIGLTERSTIDPPEGYDPEWPIRQRAFRTCRWGFEGAEDIYVRRGPGRGSRSPRLRVVGGWRMDCALDEAAIDLWNKYGPDYQPNVTESTPYEVVDDAPLRDLAPLPDDPLPPADAEAGVFPGPISVHGGARSTSTARAATHERRGCKGPIWQQGGNQWYQVAACYWGVDTPPFGAGLGIYDACATYNELYYWASSASGNYWRFYASGNTRWC